jgi:type II secretory pathway predicted ATPase ExeA
MYEGFYGLRERPFTLLPDPDFLYLSPQHKLARAYLEYGITQRLGFVVLTGEIGTGKTTLIKAILKVHEGHQRVGVLYQTSFGAEDLLELLLREFAVRGNFPTRASRLAAFNHFLLTSHRRSEQVALIVDEAQNLGPEALEELRLLSNLQAEKEPLLQVILVGQTALRDRLRQPSLRQLAQRVGVHYHLKPLDEKETREYIRFRLARAGGSGIFTESALEKIYAFTQGVPRRINGWCDLALVAGFAEGRSEIDGEFMETVFAAQGGALEGPEPEEAAEGERPTDEELGSPHHAGDNNHLKTEVLDLARRLESLEGLVLELTGQVLPALTKVLSPSPPAEPTEFREDQSLLAATPSEISSHQKNPSPRRSWWLRKFWS